MSRVAVCVLAILACRASAGTVTPTEKVITLLEDLKTEVTNDGTAEATAYGNFACFCKTQTTAKSTSIKSTKDTIYTLSADIEKNTADKAEKATELGNRQRDLEADAADHQASVVLQQKQQAEYDTTNADLSKAIGGLNGAIQSMTNTGGSFLQVNRQAIDDSLALAETLGMIESAKSQKVSALLQQKAGVDPNDPDYKYHSSGIIDTLKELKTEFTAEKASVDTEWAKAKTNLQAEQLALTTKMNANKVAMTGLEISITTLKSTIAADRISLVDDESSLKDDQIYLTDLTKRCEDRAQDYDQRAQMRADEITALSGALSVLNSKVKDREASRNASLIEAHVAPVARKLRRAAALQLSAMPISKVASFVQVESVQQVSLSQQARQDRVVTLLSQEGHRLNSIVLSSLSMKVSGDPFGKVKELIQKLIERLVNEATSEATKKGFCDEELGKAEHDRDARMADVNRLNANLAGLEAKRDELTQEISDLTTAISDLDTALTTADTTRKAEKVVNLNTISESKAGLEGVNEAITILKIFYKQAGKAASLLQWSPVDEDTEGAGFKGSYSGKQAASTGIVGLLEVIKTDFDRQLRTTQAAEEKAAAEFVVFHRESVSDIASKTTKKELDNEDLTTTKDRILRKMADLQEAQNLCDTALQRLEELKPTCIDTGMSYADRVAKRNEEIAALNKAHCLLIPDNDGTGCDNPTGSDAAGF